MAKFKSQPPGQGQFIPMYLNEWIPENHLVYVVHDIVEQLNLSNITSRYGNRGEEAYHPALMLKILFYGYATGIFTSRKLRQALEENIPFRWLSGGLKPDHRTISDFRKNNLSVLPGLFGQIIQIASDLGYISLSHVSIDGSKIKANASKHKAMSRDRMKQEIMQLEKEIADILETAQRDDQKDEEVSPMFPESIDERIIDRQARMQKIKQSLEQLESRQPQKESKMPEKDQMNFTDAQSRIMETKTQGVIQGYNPQIAVDQDQGMIVGLTMSNSSSDQKQFKGVLDSIEEHTGERPEKISADAGYFSFDNIQTAASRNVDAYIAATRENKQANNPYDKTNFTYQPEFDHYLCPAGKLLAYKNEYIEHQTGLTKRIYECQQCQECAYKNECVKSKTGKRTISRTEADPIREAMRTKVQSDEGKAVYRLRKAIVEPVWGQLKQCQGFRQFHLRGEEKVKGEFTLLALSYNLRKIHSAQYPKPSTLYKREKSAQKRKTVA